MLPDFSTIIPLDPEEFRAAHQYAGMVAENELLEDIPGCTKSRIGMPDGTYHFKKDPLILFGFAALRYFQDKPNKFLAFIHRFLALEPLLHRTEMKPYVRGVGDDQEMHHAVFEVAATEELVNQREFEPKSFFRKAREVAARIEAEQARALKRSHHGHKPALKERRADMAND
jgi:hypothetical protein